MEDYICETNLIRNHFWTKKWIDKLLHCPDLKKPNPFSKNSPKMRLYNRTKVHEIEISPGFQIIQEIIKKQRYKRQQAMLKVAERKRQEIAKQIQAIEIHIPKFSINKLYTKALLKYNDLWVTQRHDISRWVNPNPKKHSPEFLARIAVNMLRHEYTPYEDVIKEYYKHVGKEFARKELKKRVLNCIKQTYKNHPEIVTECNRQLEEELEKS